MNNIIPGDKKIKYATENLELLWFQANNLSGELPSTIGNLTNLREIYLREFLSININVLNFNI